MQVLNGLEDLFPNLTHLTVGMDRTGACAALAQVLKTLPKLQYLDLSSLQLDAHRAATLAPAIETLTGLTHLNLHMYHGIGGLAVANLIPAVKALTSLTHLDLSSSNWRRQVASSTAGFAPALCSLTGVGISNVDHP